MTDQQPIVEEEILLDSGEEQEPPEIENQEEDPFFQDQPRAMEEQSEPLDSPEEEMIDYAKMAEEDLAALQSAFPFAVG